MQLFVHDVFSNFDRIHLVVVDVYAKLRFPCQRLAARQE